MTTSFEERVCDEVRKYRHLYDRSVRDYTDGQMANNSWKEIAQTLASDEKHVRKTWKSMRDRYVKAKRKGRHGDHRAGRGKWILTSLSWLNNYVKHGELTDVKEMVEERDSSAELPSTPLSQAVETLVRQLGPPTSKGKTGVKRKVEQEFLDYQQPPLDHDEQALRAIANKSLDEDEHFVLSLVPALKRLAPYKKANVKIEIMRMITQAEFEDYHQD